MHKIEGHIYTKTGWEVIKTKYQKSQSITDGTTFLLGNGYLGYRGTFAEDKKTDYVACIVTDTWDKADGKWEELSNVPNALYASFFYKGSEINLNTHAEFYRELNVKDGLATRTVKKQFDNLSFYLNEEKIVSYSDKNLLAMRLSFSVDQDCEIELLTGIDYDTWNINGEHLKDYSTVYLNQQEMVQCKTQEKAIDVVVLSRTIFPYKSENIESERFVGKRYKLVLKANKTYVFERFMAVTTSNDYDNPKNQAQQSILKYQNFSDVYNASRTAWAKTWEYQDILLEGSLSDQLALRYNLYQAIIATPMHKPLPIGARGLSCQAYQGAAFWDQEIYNMPMYLFGNQNTAKKLLIYRYNTLQGAKNKAKKHGFEGAFYAWISGKTGDELCPDFFFKDVLSNRPIRNHFNLWQIHISFDISYAIHRYYLATEDFDFMLKYGIEMLVEIARFAASRVVYLPTKKRYEIRQVQGPDEYHENVDNNVFTNVMAKFALEYALNYLTMLEDLQAQHMKDKLNLMDNELLLWQDIQQKLYIPMPNDKGLLEQFDGYFDLESIVPAHNVTKRLIDKEEYYGWPNGITVFTQCIKQADVIQLFSLHPNVFNKEIVETNYDYYEPRTLHFSSLSPATYAIVAAQLGKTEEAYQKFRKSLLIDLLNTNESISGGTFIGGTHTAANGASWQVVLHGFLGFNLYEEGIQFNPQLPNNWQKLITHITFKGHRLKIEVNHDTLEIIALEPFKKDVIVRMKDTRYHLKKRLTMKY